MMRKELSVLSCLLLLASLSVGCGSTRVPAQFHPQVIIQTDKFQFQAGVTNYSSTLTYSWQNTGDGSSIDQGSTITSGSAFVTIKDSSGTEVYSADLMPSGTFASQQGTSGEWTVIVKLTKVTGTLNFQAQKM